MVCTCRILKRWHYFTILKANAIGWFASAASVAAARICSRRTRSTSNITASRTGKINWCLSGRRFWSWPRSRSTIWYTLLGRVDISAIWCRIASILVPIVIATSNCWRWWWNCCRLRWCWSWRACWLEENNMKVRNLKNKKIKWPTQIIPRCTTYGCCRWSCWYRSWSICRLCYWYKKCSCKLRNKIENFQRNIIGWRILTGAVGEVVGARVGLEVGVFVGYVTDTKQMSIGIKQFEDFIGIKLNCKYLPEQLVH